MVLDLRQEDSLEQLSDPGWGCPPCPMRVLGYAATTPKDWLDDADVVFR